MAKVIVEMTPEHARVVVRVLESYMRIKIGQLEHGIRDQFPMPLTDEHRARVNALLRGLRIELFPDLFPNMNDWPLTLGDIPTTYNGMPIECYCYGVCDPRCGDGRIAYDVAQVLRHAVAFHSHPGGGNTVDFHTPFCTSGLPLPTARVDEER